MKIATYNVNSINARIENLCTWLKQENPDVVLLQEIKCEFNNFPFFEIQASGYNACVLGQKSYNGVAVLSKHKINAARLYGLNPDTALERTCAKFRRRFTYLEQQTIRKGRNLKDMTLAEMDAIWDEGKAKGL